MVSLLIGVGVLFLAVVVAAILDPRPSRREDADRCMPGIDPITLSI